MPELRALLPAALLFNLIGGSAAQLRPPLLARIASEPPVSFVYGGRSSRELLPSWKKIRGEKGPAYRDPATGLEISIEMARYPENAGLEWLVRFRNTSSRETPFIESILPLDLDFIAPGSGEIILHQVRGSAMLHLAGDFAPLETVVGSGQEQHATHYVMKGDTHVDTGVPFFNLQWETGGLVGGIGWTGQWEMRLKRAAGRELSLQIGQQQTRLKLRPGEGIRTPRILVLEWSGKDRIRGHNQLRRALLAHYVPRLDGRVPLPPVAHTAVFATIFNAIGPKTGKNPPDILPALTPGDLSPDHGYPSINDGLNSVSEANQIDFIENMPEVGMEVFWMDAGWFVGRWPYGAGSWVPRPEVFPRGLKPLGDAARTRGMKFLLWFEPERVVPGTAIAKEHPQWVLHRPGEDRMGGVFNLGDPAALDWMTELLSNAIRDWGVGIYRHDRNICPLPFWRAADTPDRQGITEIRCIEGLYALWDRLLAKHPGLTIDNANWRITGPDLEVMRRSLGSLTRSEATSAGLPRPVADQAHTAALSLWVPLHSNLLHGIDPYTFRSTATTGVCFGLDLRSKYIPAEPVRKAIAELKSLRPFWLGDYYPLTPIDQDETHWCGWQFHRNDLEAGFALLFRRAKNPETIFHALLRGLDARARYRVSLSETYDAGPSRTMTGADLAHLRLSIGAAPGSVLVRYERVRR